MISLYDVTASPLTSGTHSFAGGPEKNNPYRIFGLDQNRTIQNSVSVVQEISVNSRWSFWVKGGKTRRVERKWKWIKKQEKISMNISFRYERKVIQGLCYHFISKKEIRILIILVKCVSVFLQLLCFFWKKIVTGCFFTQLLSLVLFNGGLVYSSSLPFTAGLKLSGILQPYLFGYILYAMSWKC